MSKRAQLPDGTILEFPDETPDAIMDQRVKEHLAVLQTPDKGTVSTAQAQQGFAAKPFGPDERSPSQVLQDSIGNNLEGVGQFVAGIPGMVKEAGSAILDAFNPAGMQRNVDRGMSMLQSGKDAASPLLNDTANLAAILANKRSNIPQSSPEQQRGYGNASGQFAAPLIAGAGIAAAPEAAGSLAEALRNRPTAGNVNAIKASAGANFQKALAGAKGIPLDVTEPGRIAMEAQQYASTGANLPKVISDYIKYPADPVSPIDYSIGRQFAQNAGDMAYGERALTNKTMLGKVKQFGQAMDTANREAAIKGGVVNEYDAAMKEFARASNLAEKNAIIKKWAGRIAVGTALAGTSGALAKGAWELYGSK